MPRYRQQPIVHRNTDERISEDHWLKQFENSLQKGAVQPVQVSLFDQISSVMNGAQSKYPSVQAAVDDMMQRSGLTSYLKVSEKDNSGKTKTAASDPPEESLESRMLIIKQMIQRAQDQNNLMQKQVPMEGQKQDDDSTPAVIRKVPTILTTIKNYIETTRGNLSVPAILDKVHSIHRSDIADESLWEDDNLIRLVSRLNLQAKKNNPSNFQDLNNLAVGDRDNASSDVDPSNTDAFNALMPAKL